MRADLRCIQCHVMDIGCTEGQLLIFHKWCFSHLPLVVRSDGGANFPFFFSQRRTKAMVGQCDALRDRYEDLERRKRSEAEGYQSDVRLLQQKMRRIETQLGRAAISKAKGKIENDVFGKGADV